MRPISKVYPRYTSWLKTRKSYAKDCYDGMKSSGKFYFRDWDSTRSARKLGKRALISTMEHTYQRTLNAKGMSCDLIATRFQAASMKADERAFNIRHQTIPIMLAYSGSTYYNEGNGLYKKFMTEKVSLRLALARKNRKTKE